MSLSNLLSRLGCGLALAASVFGLQTPARAQNLVQNGTFQVTNGTTSFQFGTFGSYSSSEKLADWSSPNGYNFVYINGQTTATGYYGSVSLYSQSGFTTAPGYPGGNYVALDSDYGTEAMTQTINGLTANTAYTVSFAWAGAQQTGYTGTTTDTLTVSLGGSSQKTATTTVASQGFSGWMTQTFTFIATGSSEVLSFLANGSPSVPPFVLIADVTMTKAPEPASIAILLTGVAGLAGLRSVRRNLRSRSVKA